jgi:6-bladed beta-propeller
MMELPMVSIRLTNPLLPTILLLALARPLLASEPLVVRNPDHPAWDASHRIEFTETLRIGGAEEDTEVFGYIMSIGVDSRGRIITADLAQKVVRRYDPEGTFLEQIGREGEGPGEYRSVAAVAVDAQDNIYVAGGGRVSVFDSNGKYASEFRETIGGGTWVYDLDVLGDGSILTSVLDLSTRTVIQKYEGGKHTLGFSEAIKEGGCIGPKELPAFANGCVDIGPDGMVYYTQRTPYEIRKFAPDGTPLMRVLRENDFLMPPNIEKAGNTTTFHASAGSTAICVLSDGTFVNFVSVPNGDGKLGTAVVDLFDSGGHLLYSQRVDHPLSPRCTDKAGRLYVVDAARGPSVVRYQMTIQ